MTALERAQEALGRRAWQEALDALGTDDHAAGSDAGLEIRAAATYGVGDLEGAVSAWELLHARRRSAGDLEGAAWAACMVALHLLIDTGLMSPVRGWASRGERLMEGLDDAPAHAAVAMVLTYERFMSGDADSAEHHARRAIELGTRLEVRPAVVIGRTAQARLRIIGADVEGGMALLDEVAAELMSGEVDPLTTGMMYCELICAAQSVALHDRAREWTDVMDRWRQSTAFGAIHGRCRVHRAELLRLSGPADLAEEEALAACAELRPWLRREYGWPLVELGNIQLRRGDLAGAEQSFMSAHQHVWSPQPGLSLLRLAQGRLQESMSLIAEVIEHPVDNPSKEQPPFGDLRRAPLLDAQAEIAQAAGDSLLASAASAGLSEIAERYQSPALAASAALARARAALLMGDAPAAIAAATCAVAAWGEIGAPFETASARVVLGQALWRADKVDRACREWEAARTAYEDFGAVLRADEVSALLGSADRADGSSGAFTAHATFTLLGDCRRIRYRGREALVPDLVGFRYLERLLGHPEQEFRAVDLLASERRRPVVVEPGLPVLDDEARAAYRRRLADVEEDIDEATVLNDLGRLELAQRDREYLIAELTRAVGWDGGRRSAGGSAEKARTSVTRSIRYALRRLAQHQPDLGRHLDGCVRTGTYCSYIPDPTAPIHWELGPR